MAVTALQTPKATDNGPDTGLAVLHLGKTFKTRPVLRDVSWEVKKGERVGLVGVNGAGKTTQLQVSPRCLDPSLSPDPGSSQEGRARGWVPTCGRRSRRGPAIAPRHLPPPCHSPQPRSSPALWSLTVESC